MPPASESLMNYLQPTEYETHGLESSTATAWITSASALIDAHCRRPSLAVTEYAERLRLTPGSNIVRASFLPLAPLEPATSPIVKVRARYGPPRRGEELAQDVAQAFSLPGAWIE